MPNAKRNPRRVCERRSEAVRKREKKSSKKKGIYDPEMGTFEDTQKIS